MLATFSTRAKRTLGLSPGRRNVFEALSRAAGSSQQPLNTHAMLARRRSAITLGYSKLN
jgi:hypothetical protein